MVKTLWKVGYYGTCFRTGNTASEIMYNKLEENKSKVCLMPTIQECSTFNQELLKLEKQDIVEMQAIDKIEHQGVTILLTDKLQSKLQSLEKSVSKTAGLENTLHVCINCWLSLRHNLNVEQGLVNGAMGKVVEVVKFQNRDGIEFLKVKFDQIKEVTQIGHCVVSFLLVKDLYVHRKQFPLSLAYAVTIHKSQGLSIDSSFVNIGSAVFKEGMAYVTLSRVRTLSGLYLIDFDDKKVSADANCVQEYNSLRRLYAPDLGEYPIYEKRIVCPKRKYAKDGIEVQKKKRNEEKLEGVMKKKMETVDEIVGYQLENSSSINCYANVILNVVFYLEELHCEILRNHKKRFCSLLHHVFQQLVTDRTKIHTASGVRHLLDICTSSLKFTLNVQQDAQEFLLLMLGVLQHERIQIENLFGLSYIWEHKCEECSFTSTTEIGSERFIYLTIPDCESVPFNKLIKTANQDMICSHCRSDMLSTLHIERSGEYLILIFQQCRANERKLETKINVFVASQISISGRTFIAVAIIIRDGPTTTSGHYTV